jgi:hypothetical protein
MDVANLAYVVSALLAVIILIDVSVLWLTGKQVPDLLAQLVIAVFASYFASGLARSRGRANGSGEGGPASKEAQ